MKRLMKLLSYLLSMLMAFCFFLGVFLFFFVKPNSYKSEIAAKITQMTGRDFAIHGNLKWVLFPTLGFEANASEFYNRSGFHPRSMLEVKKLELDLKIWPLLRHEIIINKIIINGADFNLIRNADGESSWDDLVRPPSSPAETKEKGATSTQKANPVVIHLVDVRRVNVKYNDRHDKRSVNIRNLNFHAENILFGNPLLSTLVASSQFDIDQFDFNRLRINNLVIYAKLNHGNVILKPIRGRIAKGLFTGDFTYNKHDSTPVFKVNEKIASVDALALADMLVLQTGTPLGKVANGLAKLPITGDTNVDIHLEGSGNQSLEIKKSLKGTISFKFSRGVLSGISANDWLSTGLGKLMNFKEPALFGSLKTNFSTLSGTINIKDGIGDNPDFKLSSPHLAITGSGKFNLIDNTMDYHLQLYHVESGKRHGAIIPIIIDGDIASPTVKLDASKILKEKFQKERDNLEQKVKEELKKNMPNIKIPPIKKLLPRL